MSTWTHVIGAIRFDGLAGMTPEPDLGKTVNFEDDEAVWDECDVPRGSEGSLEYILNTSSDPSQLARWTACIFGDLRDYEDDDEIIAYFNRITSGRMVRGGTFCIECEGQGARTFTYIDNNESWNDKPWHEMKE